MNNTILIENYLLGELEPADKLVMDAKLLLDAELRDKTEWQQRTYALVKTYSRASLKKEINAVHKKMFSETRFESFRKKINNIFK